MNWLRYSNQGATRNRPLNPRLAEALSFLPSMGLSVDVFSGGQPSAREGGARTGSVRHDHGNSADVFFSKGGRRLDWASAADRPLFEEIVRRGKAAGITGFGAGPGYMQAGSMHVGFGAPGVWGAGGKGANAPGWLRSAFDGTPIASQPAPAASVADLFDGTPAANQSAPLVAPEAVGTPKTVTTVPVEPDVGQIAALFLRGHRQIQERRAEEARADQERRIALFGGNPFGPFA